MRRWHYAFLPLGLGLLVGCAAAGLRLPATSGAMSPPPLSMEVSTEREALPEGHGSGEVRVAVRWPELSIQAIPLSASELEVALTRTGTTVATGSIVRPVTVGRLTAIPAGSYVLAVQARRLDAGRTVVAQATASIDVVANRVASAALVLAPSRPPRLTSLSRASVRVGGAVFLNGENLGVPQGGTYSVLVDDRPIPALDLQPSNNQIAFLAPSWLASNSTVKVSVDGLLASGVLSLSKRVLHHLRIGPENATVSVGASQAFQFRAFLDAGETQEATDDVAFVATLTDCDPSPNPDSGFQPFVLSGQTFTAQASGTTTLRLAAEGLVASTPITVLAPSTLPTPTPPPGGLPNQPPLPGAPSWP